MTLNNVLVEQQSGFRPQHSTETTLLSSTNEWLYNMDRGLLSGVLFLDLNLKKLLILSITTSFYRSLNYKVLVGIALNGSIQTLKVETNMLWEWQVVIC
jgi:hypothetical protein